MPSQRTPPTLPSLPAEAALSFLKDTKATLTWSPRDLSESLNINRHEADQVLAFLQAQGYAHPASVPGGGKDEWLTTPAGETVSGAKPPRFTRERVEQALADLQARIQQNNKDPHSPFRVATAVAFGDFLLKDRSRVQAADVGITLARREHGGATLRLQSRVPKYCRHRRPSHARPPKLKPSASSSANCVPNPRSSTCVLMPTGWTNAPIVSCCSAGEISRLLTRATAQRSVNYGHRHGPV